MSKQWTTEEMHLYILEVVKIRDGVGNARPTYEELSNDFNIPVSDIPELLRPLYESGKLDKVKGNNHE